MSIPGTTCGPGAISTTSSWIAGSPIKNGILLPALLLAIACGPSFVAYVPTKTGCDGNDSVALNKDGWGHWVGKGDVTFQVMNTPTPKNVCVVELDKDKATAFMSDRSFTWDVWNKEHQG